MYAAEYLEWDLALKKAERELSPGLILKLQKQLAFLTLGAAVELAPGKYKRLTGVVLLTPVDTGRARASWNVAIGNPDTSVPASAGFARATPASKVSEARERLSSLGVYQTVWVTSSLPYIRVLEFGLYPNPPKRGSWDKRKKQWVIKSSGGFSKQAPAGMVRVTFEAIKAALGEVAA